jgi:tetratricopeptide (TPR) repeat protein
MHGGSSPHETAVTPGSSGNLPALPAIPEHQDNPIYVRGKSLCLWLQKVLQALPVDGFAQGLGGMLRGLISKPSRCGDPLEALERFRQELERAPRHRELLLDLARFFEQQQLYELARFVLKEVHRVDPSDIDLLLTIGKICLVQARQPGLPADRSLEAYDTAVRYLERTRKHRPQDTALEALLRDTQAERTIRQGSYDARTGVRASTRPEGLRG